MSGGASKAATASSPRSSGAASWPRRSRRWSRRTRSCARRSPKAELARNVDRQVVCRRREEPRGPAGAGAEAARGTDVLSRHRFARGRHRRVAHSALPDPAGGGRAALSPAARAGAVDAPGRRRFRRRQHPDRGCARQSPRAAAASQMRVRRRAPTGQLPFQFRYFQNLEQDVVLPDGLRAARGQRRGALDAPRACARILPVAGPG